MNTTATKSAAQTARNTARNSRGKMVAYCFACGAAPQIVASFGTWTSRLGCCEGCLAAHVAGTITLPADDTQTFVPSSHPSRRAAR